jgi:hypothetical protein
MGASPGEGTSKPSKNPLTNQHLYPPGIGVRKRRLAESHRLVVSPPRLEYPVDEAAVKVEVLIAIPFQNSNIPSFF